MTPSEGRTTGGEGEKSTPGTSFQHLVSEAGEQHVAVVGRHDLRPTRPGVPSHLIEITRVDVELDPGTAGDTNDRVTGESESDRTTQALAVREFLAD